jgi:hypothetical protein
MFASGSSDGFFVIWNATNLIKMIILKPFEELVQNEAMYKLNLTSISCAKPISEVTNSCKRSKY